jgi:hypothetical protein
MTTQYSVKIGKEVIDFEGPDDLTDRQIERLADTTLRKAKPGQTFPHSMLVSPGSFETQQQAQNKSSGVGSFFRNIPHDALLNWDDEIASAGNAAIPGLASLDNALGMSGGNQTTASQAGGFSKAFNQNMSDAEQQQQADDTQHSMASSLGRVLGVAGTLPAAGERAALMLPGVAREAMAAHPLLTAMGAGGTVGAVSGAGAGRGNREQSAALGGLSGAALAFGLTGAIKFAPTVARYASMIFNKSGGATKEAVHQISQALMRDGFDVSTPQGAQALRDELSRYSGKPVSLADIGQATRSRTGVALRTPSAAQQRGIDVVANRQAGAPTRLATDIRQNIAPRTDVHALDEALIAQRAEEAGPLREKALFEEAPDPAEAITNTASSSQKAGVARTLAREVAPTAENPVVAGGRQSRIVDDPELQNLARLPLAQRALTAALGQAEAERGLLATTGKSIEHLPDLGRGSQLDMRTFDYLKRYLDDEVNRLYKRGDTQTFSAQEANQVKSLRNAIRERLRAVNPEYGDYLDAYKGSSEMIDALDEGRSFDRLDPEEIATGQGKRSTAAQELYRVGAARSILDKIRDTRDGASAARRVLNSDESRSQLAATGVSEPNLRRLNNAVSQERTLSLLPEELKGSQTAQRLLAQADADAGSHPPLPFNPGSPFGWAGAAIRGALNYVNLKRNASVNEQLLPRLLEADPSAVQHVVGELERHGQTAQAKALARAFKSRKGSVGSSAVIGGMVALPKTGEDDGY